MSISPNLLFAILSLASYNRGYNPGITPSGPDGLGETGQVGPLSVVNPQSIGRTETQYAAWQAANFYAVAYQESPNNIVISYRGTDAPLGDSPGWSGGAGVQTAQAELAAKFYY